MCSLLYAIQMLSLCYRYASDMLFICFSRFTPMWKELSECYFSPALYAIHMLRTWCEYDVDMLLTCLRFAIDALSTCFLSLPLIYRYASTSPYSAMNCQWTIDSLQMRYEYAMNMLWTYNLYDIITVFICYQPAFDTLCSPLPPPTAKC